VNSRGQNVMVRTQEKSSQRRAMEGMSKVQSLHQRLSSGPVKSELRTVSESIHAARALYKQIELAGIETKDFFVHIGYLTPDLPALFTQPFTPGQEAATQEALSGKGMCCIPAGLTFGIRDWQRKNWSLGARPFLTTPLVRTAFANWLEEMRVTNADGQKTS
jgi:hypothetical protein